MIDGLTLLHSIVKLNTNNNFQMIYFSCRFGIFIVMMILLSTLIMNIIFTTINKKICTTDYQKKLWDGAESMAKNQVQKKMEMMKNYLGDLSINITIDMAKGIPSIVKNNLSEDQFLAAQQALHSKL